MEFNYLIKYDSMNRPIEISFTYYDKVKVILEYQENKLIVINLFAEAEGDKTTNLIWRSNLECDYTSIPKTEPSFKKTGNIQFNQNGSIFKSSFDNSTKIFSYDINGNILKITENKNAQIETFFENFENQQNPFSTNLNIWTLLSNLSILPYKFINKSLALKISDNKYEYNYSELILDTKGNTQSLKEEILDKDAKKIIESSYLYFEYMKL